MTSPNGLREQIAELAADWAAPADRPATLTRDEIVEQHVYGECAKSLRELLNEADTTPAAPGTAPGGGAQEAATPGRAAYEVWLDSMAAQGVICDDWDELTEEDRTAWEAAAEAANLAGLARVLAACARYKAERDEAREQLATCRERNAAIAVQLDQYQDERDEARGALERIRDESPSHGYGWHARIAREALEGGGDASS